MWAVYTPREVSPSKPLANASEAQLAEAIRRVGQPGFEVALLELFRRCMAPDNLVALTFHDSGPPQALFHQASLPQVFAQLDTSYLGGAYLLDPYHDLHLRRAPPGLYRLSDIAPDAFQRSRYFLEYYRQTTIIDELTFLAYPAEGVSLMLCLGRDASSGRPFGPRDVETGHRIAPIVVALAEMHWATLPSRSDPPQDVVARLIGAMRDEHGIRLSPRQTEVALLILRGHSTLSIALRLGLSAQTVKVFRKQLYGKCRISSQAELFAMMLPLLSERA